MPDRSDLTAAPPNAAELDARAAMDALGDAIVVIGADGRVRYINAPWERILGVRRTDAVGADFWTTYPGLDMDPGAEMIRATATDGATRRYDLEHWVGGELRSYGVRVARDTTGSVVLALSRSFQTVMNRRDKALVAFLERNLLHLRRRIAPDPRHAHGRRRQVDGLLSGKASHGPGC